MKFIIDKTPARIAQKKIDCAFIPVWLGTKGSDRQFSSLYAGLSEADQKTIQGLLNDRKRKSGETHLVRLAGSVGYAYLVLEEAFTEKKVILAIRRFIRRTKNEGYTTGAFCADDFERDNISAVRMGSIIAQNSLLAHYDFSEQYKTAPTDGWKKIASITIATLSDIAALKKAITTGEYIAQAVNNCRTLANIPPSDLKPEGMAEAAKTAAKTTPGLSVTVFDEKKLRAMGMNAILAVGQGSMSPPRLIMLEYRGGGKSRSIAFVGKGVTFDSGGLNIKPGEHMADMHMDMSGGAAVIYALQLIAQLKLPVNVIGLVPAVENMPSGISYRQGDIIKAYGGKTIEIGNTDAEGRVILSDAIEYAKTKKPELIITLATLTGAVMGALGVRMAGLFVKENKPLSDKLCEIGEISGDSVWPLPLTADSERDCESAIADVINTNKAGSRYGGASTAAGFLSHFAQGVPFAHIDMASRMTTLPEEEALSRGAAGYGVRYFLAVAQQWQELKKLL